MEPSSDGLASVTNDVLADRFLEVADLLEAQHADFYRVRGWQQGAAAVRAHAEPIVELLERGGRHALVALPHIGEGLAAAIEELAHTWRLGVLDRLRGHVSPQDLFITVPGIGEELAAHIHEELHIETLEELEAAAHDGRLEQIHGVGPRRAEGIRDILATRLSRGSRRHARRIPALHAPGAEAHLADPAPPIPPVDLLLHVDRDYRDLASQGRLPRIAPSRFNPTHEAWLPVLHRYSDGWDFEAMFSNSARAHQLERTRDWVVIYWHRGSHEGQCTVVTEYRGPMEGQRVVRGREEECMRWHDGHRGPTGREIVDTWLAKVAKLTAVLGVLTLAACAAHVEVGHRDGSKSGPAVASSQRDADSALLLTADGYELHYQKGRVYKLTWASPEAPAVRRPVESWREFRGLYAGDTLDGGALPLELPDAGVEVAGWRGQECVREGHPCGQMPEDPPPGLLVRLTLQFAR